MTNGARATLQRPIDAVLETKAPASYDSKRGFAIEAEIMRLTG